MGYDFNYLFLQYFSSPFTHQSYRKSKTNYANYLINDKKFQYFSISKWRPRNLIFKVQNGGHVKPSYFKMAAMRGNPVSCFWSMCRWRRSSSSLSLRWLWPWSWQYPQSEINYYIKGSKSWEYNRPTISTPMICPWQHNSKHFTFFQFGADSFVPDCG